MKIDIEIPKAIGTLGQHQAIFTRSNLHFRKDGRLIEGLNFGFNTAEERSFIELNRSTLFKALDLRAENVAWANQIHGVGVTTVREGGLYPQTDALVTNTKGLALGILVADCAAVLFSDEENGVIGAAHSGWKGTVGNIVSKTITAMCALGAKVESMKVYVSPCISVSSFEVGEEVAAQFDEKYVLRTWEKPHIDMKACIYDQLLATQIPADSIELSDECTLQSPDLYSYRRQKERSGRMLGLVRIN